MAEAKEKAAKKAKTKAKVAPKKKKKKAPAKVAASSGQTEGADAATEKSNEFRTLHFQDFTISKKRSGRFEVWNKKGKNVNAADKVKVLIDAKLLKASTPKAPAEPAAAEGEAPPAT